MCVFRHPIMMTTSNGNIFRVTGHLCGEFTGPGEFPTQRPVTRSFDVFFDLRLNKRLCKQSWGWWFETLLCPLWRHSNEDTVKSVIFHAMLNDIFVHDIHIYVLSLETYTTLINWRRNIVFLSSSNFDLRNSASISSCFFPAKFFS